MVSIESVVSKASRQSSFTIAPALNKARYVRHKWGVLLNVRGGAIVLTPPLIITAEEVSHICDAVIDVVNQIDVVNYVLAPSAVLNLDGD